MGLSVWVDSWGSISDFIFFCIFFIYFFQRSPGRTISQNHCQPRQPYSFLLLKLIYKTKQVRIPYEEWGWHSKKALSAIVSHCQPFHLSMWMFMSSYVRHYQLFQPGNVAEIFGKKLKMVAHFERNNVVCNLIGVTKGGWLKFYLADWKIIKDKYWDAKW